MAIYIGNNSLSAAHIGVTSVSSIWLGTNKLWPTTPPSYKFQATYLGGSVYSLECDEYDDITYFDAHPQGYEPSAMTEAYIGDCVKTVGNQCFHQNKSLSSVTISSGVTSLGESCFSYCTSLEYIYIPSTVEVLGKQCFFNSSGLTSIDLEEGLTTIGQGCFEQCVSLSSLTIPSTVTVIGRQAFNSCTSLESLTVFATTPPTISGSNTFQYTDCPIYVPCESLDDYKTASYWQDVASRIQPIQGTCPKLMAKYSNGDKYIKACDSSTVLSRDEIRASGYEYSAMTDAVIGDCVTRIGTINGGFYDCTSLSSVTIPNSVTSLYTGAFRNCTSLTSITIPSGVTYVGEASFNQCTSLTSVTLPSGVTEIATYAFYNCTSLQSVTIEATTPPTLGDTQVFKYTNNCPIYVPCESIDTYKAANKWSYYASRIQPIPNSCPQTLQWVTFNNGDTIPSDLDIYGFSGTGVDLVNTFAYSSTLNFTQTRNTVEYSVSCNGEMGCWSDVDILATDTIEEIIADHQCNCDCVNIPTSVTVSGTIQLYIYA